MNVRAAHSLENFRGGIRARGMAQPSPFPRPPRRSRNQVPRAVDAAACPGRLPEGRLPPSDTPRRARGRK